MKKSTLLKFANLKNIGYSYYSGYSNYSNYSNFPRSSFLIPHSSFLIMYKHILIDLDDTLWDFRRNSKIAMQEIFNDYELIKFYDSFESFYSIYMEKNHQLWEQYAKGEITKDFLAIERFLYPLRIVGNENLELAKKLGEDFLYRTTMQTNLVDGAIETIEYLKAKGYTLSIISNGFVEVQYTKLRRSGLFPYFANVFLSEEVGYQKPDIRFFKTVLNKLNTHSSECLVIGDNIETDIQGAQNANIRALFYKNNTDIPSNFEFMGQIIENLIEIKAIL